MYKIKLPNFEGPFDLLLYFIKKDEINIYDIPIAKIALEFLNYIRLIKYFDIELAGEFIYMAANLMYIKSQMMLPRVRIDGTEEFEDPRSQLVKKLIEYRQIKDGAVNLSDFYEDQKYTFYRNIFDAQQAEACGEVYKNTTLFDLMRAFQKALDKAKGDDPHTVQMVAYTIDEKMDEILIFIQKNRKVSFFSFINGQSKISIVVTFLAILNLMRDNKIFVKQNDNFDDIVIFGK